MNHKKIILLTVINIVLIVFSKEDQGRYYFITLPIMLLLDIVSLVYSIVKNDRPLIIVSLVLIVLSPIIGFIIFVKAFPFLTR